MRKVTVKRLLNDGYRIGDLDIILGYNHGYYLEVIKNDEFEGDGEAHKRVVYFKPKHVVRPDYRSWRFRLSQKLFWWASANRYKEFAEHIRHHLAGWLHDTPKPKIYERVEVIGVDIEP